MMRFFSARLNRGDNDSPDKRDNDNGIARVLRLVRASFIRGRGIFKINHTVRNQKVRESYRGFIGTPSIGIFFHREGRSSASSPWERLTNGGLIYRYR